MTSLSLYRPEDEALLGLLDALDATQPGSLERADADAAIARFLSSQTAIERVDTLCSVFAGMDAQLQGADTQLMRIKDKKARIESAIARLQAHTVHGMTTFGVKRIAGTAQSIVLIPNPEAVDFTDETLVPDEFKTVKVTMAADHWKDIADLLADTGNDALLDAITVEKPLTKKSLIKPVLKGGGGVPGAFLAAGFRVERK